MAIIPFLSGNRVVEQNLTPTQRFRNWILDVERLSVITGSGSPEGVVAADVARMYMDESGASGSILYIKQLADIGGDVTKGWILV